MSERPHRSRPPGGRKPTVPARPARDFGIVKVGSERYAVKLCQGRSLAVWVAETAWTKRFVLSMLAYPRERFTDEEGSDFEAFMSFLEKALGGAGSPPGGGVACCPWLRGVCPAVHEFVTAAAHPDGRPRATSTLLLFVEDGVFKVCLSEREHSLTLWASASGVDEALMVLEERLTAQNVEWRRKAQPTNKGPQRGKGGA